MDRRLIVPLLILILTVPALTKDGATVLGVQASADQSAGYEWKTIRTDSIIIRFPSGGGKPMFLWWYVNEPENIYVVKFVGLTEYFSFETPYYNHRFQAENQTFGELAKSEMDNPQGIFKIKPGLLQRQRALEIVEDIIRGWGHKSYLSFSECNWELQDLGLITSPGDGTKIGLTFTFNLTKVRGSKFDFAEGNIAIRVRFYNTTVIENVKDLSENTIYSYQVGANEMKIDLIIRDWRWNLDLAQPLLNKLEELGMTIPQTKTSLALGLRLASTNPSGIKTTPSTAADYEIEERTRRLVVENQGVRLSDAQTDDETPVEVAKGPNDYFTIRYASDNKTLGGYFKFTASAMVSNSTGSYKEAVKASYKAEGAGLSLYISYPYFTGTLVHDPLIGVEGTEKPTANTPNYQVTVEEPTKALTVQAIPQIFSTNFVVVLAVVASAITMSLLLTKSRGRSIILRSLY